jgi:hypothetical protein
MARVSALVGMVCPGLHSVMAGVDLDLSLAPDGDESLSFRTTSVDERFKLVRMDVSGAGVMGKVEAFIRPEPVSGSDLKAVFERVDPHQFAGRRALVVGGSRGLGATTAKLLAAGGADVKLTYASGSAEAAALCDLINDAGRGECEAIRLDVTEEIAPALDKLPWRPTHVYYFATPRIFLQKSPAFSREHFERFITFYVEAFDAFCTDFAKAPQPVSIFYPSSVAVAERPLGLTEYTMAKAAGELLCADLAKMHPQLHIAVHRLPRVLTDQTATIQHVESADAAEIMLPLLLAEPS